MTLAHADVISRLTLEQKARLTAGADFWHTLAVPEEGIPAVSVADGPHGLRVVGSIGIRDSAPATCFPPAVALGSSWNAALARRVGEAIAVEAKSLDVNVVLGPGVNIKRSPLCGRNFEYFSEDPLVAGVMGAAWVEGAQSTGVGTSLKHFAANNQETDRMRVSAEIDERTLREIYLSAFEHIVKTAAPTTVMCSYNRINGVYSSENRWLLTDVLRGEWGFDGLVMSDWGAVIDRSRAIAAGLDLRMPLPGPVAQVTAAVADGALDEALLDLAVDNVLTLADWVGSATDGGTDPEHAAHHELAHEAALESAVLLKNEGGILPLTDASGSIAVIGEFARTPRYQGAGSSQVVPTRLDTALDALAAVLGERVSFAPGFAFDGAAASGEEAQALSEQAVALAAASDTVVLFLGLPGTAESEGFDRSDILLPSAQLALLDRIAAVNPNVVVVLSNGALVSVAEWQRKAKAVLEGWLLGQAGGAATAELLLGQANPSGRLTETIPIRLSDTPAYLNFPGGEGTVLYGERIYVGYRHYDSRGLPVAYPFGHGLSYTEFAYGELELTQAGGGASASFTVINTGSRAGAEVAQLYRHDEGRAVDRPEQELVGFAKVFLQPGESTRVTIELDARAFAYWSIAKGDWVVEEGEAELRVGSSSRDIRLAGTVGIAASGPQTELTAMSSIAEWFADPLGEQILKAALAQAPDEVELTLDPETTDGQMFLALPLAIAFGFNPGVPEGAAEQLVDAWKSASGR